MKDFRPAFLKNKTSVKPAQKPVIPTTQKCRGCGR